MSDGLPKHVDAGRLAARQARIENATPVAEMTRLAGLLAETTGRVDSVLQFSRASGRIRIDGEAHTRVQATCQRCLAAMPVALDVDIAVAVVEDEAAADALPDGIEPAFGEDGQVSPLAVVEDELILAMPVVPTHAAGECEPPVDVAPKRVERENPFSVLRQLKNKR